jgi:hypothetical protein
MQITQSLAHEVNSSKYDLSNLFVKHITLNALAANAICNHIIYSTLSNTQYPELHRGSLNKNPVIHT